MALQSQLGTINSTLAVGMSLGVALGAGGPPVHTENVSSSITFLSTSRGFIEDVAFESTLNLASTLLYVVYSPTQSTSDTISLTHTVLAARDMPLGVSNTLSFSSLGGRIREGVPANTLNLYSIVAYFNFVADRQPVGNILGLTQAVTTLSGLDVSQLLGITQAVTVQAPFKPSVTHVLGLSHRTSTPYHMWIEHTIGFNEDTRIPLVPQSVADILNFVSETTMLTPFSTLNLTHSASFSFSLTATNILYLVDEMDLIGVFVRSISQTLGIGHALTWYEDTPCGRKQYTPFQGENTITTTVTAPPNVLQDPQGSLSDRFALYQPALGVRTDEVILRAPELDNRDRNAHTRVSRETRGGKLTVYSDPTWPNIRTLAVTLVGLSETQVDDLHSFLQDTVGQTIGITDWEGRLWEGFITNPDEVATQDGKDRWTVTLEFEGEMLTVEQPGNDDGGGMAMNITDTVDVYVAKWFTQGLGIVDAAIGVIV